MERDKESESVTSGVETTTSTTSTSPNTGRTTPSEELSPQLTITESRLLALMEQAADRAVQKLKSTNYTEDTRTTIVEKEEPLRRVKEMETSLKGTE